MPQVASDPAVYAHSSHLPRLARPALPSDRAPSPFESLLDAGTQATDQPPATPPDNKPAPPDSTQPQAKTNDSKPPAADDKVDAPLPKPQDQANETATTISADTKPAGGAKTAVDAQLVEDAPDGVNAKAPKAESDDKSADGQQANDTTATPANPNIVQSVTVAANAVAVAPAPTPTAPVQPGQNNQGNEPTQPPTLVAEVGLPQKTLVPGTPKSIAGKPANADKALDTDQQAGIDQGANAATDASQTPTKATTDTHSAKPQISTDAGSSDKDRVAQARGEPTPNGHHTGSDVPAPVATDAGTAAPKTLADTSALPTVSTAPAQAAANTPVSVALVSPPSPQAAAIPLSGIAIEIAGKALSGKNRFEIRLDPPELGRIEVRLDVDRDGNVTSRLTVDRTDTLDLLRRDASGLERALQDAGLKTADNGLQFSLRDQSMSQQQMNSGADTAQIIVKDETLPSIDAIPQNYGRLAGTGGGLDIRV